MDFFTTDPDFGQLWELGMPWGKGGRVALLRLLARATGRRQWCLWVYDREDLSIYPPAWAAAGVDLSYVRIAPCRSPQQGSNRRPRSGVIEDLKAMFMSDFFKIIVIDSHLTLQDYAFLARRARLQGQMILVLRNHFLSPQLGNIWAKVRLNCWMDPVEQRVFFTTVKGQSNNRSMSFTLGGMP